MDKPRALVLRAAGINCDLETEHALQTAGAEADRIHINSIIEKKETLEEYQILVFPGGFSYGDDIAAGKILSNQIIHHLAEPIKKFIDDGKLILGICNGFQVLVKTGILPGINGNGTCFQDKVTIAHNDCGKFEDRWVHLEPVSEKCVFIEPGRRIYLPIAHGEGKVLTSSPEILEKLEKGGHIAFRYVDRNGKEGPFPVNPNGSANSIAGLTDKTGRVMGLMPHPERFIVPTHHPQWTRNKGGIEADGISIFNNAVKYIKENL